MRLRRSHLVPPHFGNTIGPGTGSGIPEVVFTNGYHETLTLPSRRTLTCMTDSQWVYIYDTEPPVSKIEYLFRATIDPANDNRLELDIRNRHPNDPHIRHPDIYPSLLVARSILYFEGVIGQNLTRLLGRWGDKGGDQPQLSDNWSSYVGHLATFGTGPYSREQQVAAAETAWTAGVARENGFRTVGSIEDTTNGGKYVEVEFLRGTV